MKTSRLLTLAILFTSALTYAQSVHVDEKGVILGGYDAVSYFSEGGPVLGDEQYSVTYEGAVYYFSNESNLGMFKKNPSKYAPQYGAFCAWAVGEKNTKFPGDPETFKITNGKLYVLYNGPTDNGNFNAYEPWVNDESRLIKQADKNWKSLK